MVVIPTNTTLLREILTDLFAMGAENRPDESGRRLIRRRRLGLDAMLRPKRSAQNVLAVLMPYKSSHPDSQAHAEMIARASGIESMFADINRRSMPTSSAFPTLIRAGAATRWRASA